MVPVKEAAAEFLAKKRIAVTGVSRTPKDHGGNVVYKRLRDRGYQVARSIPTPTRSKATVATVTLSRSPAVSRRL